MRERSGERLIGLLPFFFRVYSLVRPGHFYKTLSPFHHFYNLYNNFK